MAQKTTFMYDENKTIDENIVLFEEFVNNHAYTNTAAKDQDQIILHHLKYLSKKGN